MWCNVLKQKVDEKGSGELPLEYALITKEAEELPGR
jgi:hypothetical protein